MKRPLFRKALVIYKEELKPHLSIGRRPNPSLIRRNSHLTEHEKTLIEVERVLKKKRIDHRIVSRGNLNKVKGFDLLITVGGDGTFLDTSHYATSKQILLGVNSHPQQSHGALCIADRKNFEKILTRFIHSRGPLLLLPRIRVRIRGKNIPILALNDILFANRSPAGTSRYLLKVKNKSEVHKSSGIWISTAAGSTAALRSAGGKVMPKRSKDLQFVVREPFVTPGRRYRILKGRISQGGSIQIVSNMSKAGVFLDGAHLQYDVGFKDLVEIRGGGDPVRAVLRS